jgi:hypothetical protein
MVLMKMVYLTVMPIERCQSTGEGKDRGVRHVICLYIWSIAGVIENMQLICPLSEVFKEFRK